MFGSLHNSHVVHCPSRNYTWRACLYQARKGAQTKLLGPDILRWGGGLPREGVGPKSSVCPPKPRENKLFFKNEKSAQRGSFWDGHPADIQGSFARISRPKTSVRSVKILDKKKQGFRRGHPWPEGADVHDPKRFPKLRSEKLWAEFSFPIFWRDIPGFWRDIQDLPEKFETIMFVFYFWPCHCSGISKPVVWGSRGLHSGFSWFSSFSWFPWFPRIRHSTPCV